MYLFSMTKRFYEDLRSAILQMDFVRHALSLLFVSSLVSGTQSHAHRGWVAEYPEEPDLVDPNLCGKSVTASTFEELSNVRNASRGAWPWIAAVFKNTDSDGFEFICGATLISRRQVITAAHCVKYDDRIFLPDDQVRNFFVSLGLHNPRQIADINGQLREVEKIYFVTHFQISIPTAYDLAIMRLKDAVVYNPYVRPICLWMGSKSSQAVLKGGPGTVVHWDKKKKSNGPLASPMRIVSQETCLRNDPKMLKLTSYETFCAEILNDFEFCNEGDGSGLFVHNDDRKATYLRGVLSYTQYDPETKSCNRGAFVIFSDLDRFHDWWQKFIQYK